MRICFVDILRALFACWHFGFILLHWDLKANMLQTGSSLMCSFSTVIRKMISNVYLTKIFLRRAIFGKI